MVMLLTKVERELKENLLNNMFYYRLEIIKKMSFDFEKLYKLQLHF